MSKNEYGYKMNNDESERMIRQAWLSLHRISQPLIFGIFLGKLVTRANNRYAGAYYGLIVPSVAWPMVGLATASCINLGYDDQDKSICNYAYYGLIGCLASVATLSAKSTQYFFEQLNDGILKNVFTGTLVSYQKGHMTGLSLGLNVMVAFHTLYAIFHKRIHNFAFALRLSSLISRLKRQ